MYCTPNQHAVEAQAFQEGPITLTNQEHEEYSVVSVVSEPGKKSFLLELASAMTGLGVTIHEAIIQVRLCHKISSSSVSLYACTFCSTNAMCTQHEKLDVQHKHCVHGDICTPCIVAFNSGMICLQCDLHAFHLAPCMCVF